MSLEEAHALATKCLLLNGCDEANARAAADRMIQAEGDLCHSHGLFRLPWYAAGVKSGRANGKAKPRLEQLAPAVIRVDGDGGFAPLGQAIAHQPLVDCARENGIAALAFVNMFHVAAMWPEVEKLALDGLCAFACTPSYPYVAPAGGTKPVFVLFKGDMQSPDVLKTMRETAKYMEQSPDIFTSMSVADLIAEINFASGNKRSINGIIM